MRPAVAIAVVLLVSGVPLRAASAEPAETGETVHDVGKQSVELRGRIMADDPKVAVDTLPDTTLTLPAKHFLVRLTGGKGYRLTMQSKEFDSFLVVQDADGRQLDFDGDSGGGQDSALTLEVAQNAVYRIAAASFKGNGAFTLAIRERQASDPPPLSQADRVLHAQAASLSLQASQFYQRGEARKAIPVAEQALAIRKKILGEHHFLTAPLLNNLGLFHQAQGDSLASRNYLAQALAIYKKVQGEQHPNTATALNNLGSLLRNQGDYASARSYLEQALAIRQKALGDQHPDTALSLNDLGLLLQEQGDFAAARTNYEQAFAIYKKALGEQHPTTATLLNNLGKLLRDQGDHATARSYYEKALVSTKKALGEHHPLTATLLNNLGGLLHDQGDHATARTYYEQALAIFKKALGEQHPNTATMLDNLAPLLRSQGDSATARSYLEQALAIRQKALGEQHPLTAASLNNLGSFLRDQGDSAAAFTYQGQALAITRKVLGEQHPSTATLLNNVGSLLQDQGDYAAARPYYEQALAIYKKVLGEQHPLTAASLRELGALLRKQGEDAAARDAMEAALRIQRRALDLAADALAERQQLDMTHRTRFSLDNLLAASAENGALAAADLDHVLAWKGAVSARQHQTRLLRREPTIAPLAERLRNVTAKLANLASAIPDLQKAESHRAALVQLTQDKEDLEVEIARLSASFRQGQERARLTSAGLAALIPPDAALVDFFVYHHDRPDPAQKGKWLLEPRLTAFVLRHDHPVVRVELGPVDKVAAAIGSWRRTLLRDAPSAEGPPGQALRQLVWAPLTKHLAGARTIFIAPDREIARIPFAALPGESPGTYLLEERTFVVIPLPRLFPAARNMSLDRGPESLLLVGSINYGAEAGQGEGERGPRTAARTETRAFDFGPLNNTRGEILTLRDAFERRFTKGKVTLLCEDDATETALRKEAPAHRWLHVATHGFFAPPELRSAEDSVEARGRRDLFGKSNVRSFHPGLLSGLALAGANRVPEPGADDGILTALEVAELDLRKTELVVLSACETGLGKVAGGEGVLGLQRSFQIAGAESVIASLWQVDDAATRALMEKFYDNLWNQKLPKAEALRQAQLYLLQEGPRRGLTRGVVRVDDVPNGPRRSPPYFWAAFVLSGEWR